MSATYDYWRNALAGNFGPVHDGDAQPGFYRKRAFKDGPWQPVAIWEADGAMVAMVDAKAADPAQLWSWVCRYPVTEAAYHKARTGAGWGDEPPAPVVASNLSADPHEALTQEYQGEVEAAQEFLGAPITTKEQADKAAIWSKRLATIAKKATDLHKVEKQPHLDAGRGVDDKWRDLKEGAAEWATKLKRHLDAYLREEDRKERERQAAARIEAERIRREAEIAAQKSDAAEAERLAAQAAQAERETEARNAGAGRTGAKVALRTFTSAEITDFDALLMALKDRPEIQELVQTLANRAAKSGVELPGMSIKEERRAA